MWDLETMRELNAPKPQGKVSSDGRVCTDYVSRPINLRFYVAEDESKFLFGANYVYDTIELQGYGPFGPMPRDAAIELAALLNNLTKV